MLGDVHSHKSLTMSGMYRHQKKSKENKDLNQ